MEEYRKMARAKKIKKDEINNAEFFAALKAMEEERGIPMEFIEEKLFFIESRKKYELNYKESALLFFFCSNIQTMYYLCKINGVVYHQKRLYKEDVVDELLGKIISEYFEDKCVLSKIIRDEY